MSRTTPTVVAAATLLAAASPAAADTRPKEAKDVLFQDLDAEIRRGIKTASQELPFKLSGDEWDALECYVDPPGFVGCEAFGYTLYCSKSMDGWSCGCSQPNGHDCELPDLPEE